MRFSACDTVSPVLCPARALLTHIPLGPRPWLHQLRSRLPGLVRRLHSYYGGGRLLTIVHHRLRLLAFPTRTSAVRMWLANHEISRFPSKERPYMPGSSTTLGCPSACVGAIGHIAFRYTDSVGTRNQFSIAAQWLACTFPYRRFADILADACARLGADVVRYSFIVVDLHHLLLAGLPAHPCKNSLEPKTRRIFFSTVVLNGGSTPLMNPEMQFRRIMFSTFCPRASFHTAWTHNGRMTPD